MSFRSSFDDRSPTVIDNIVTDEGYSLSFGQIEFGAYDNPDIAIDTSARFAVHEIIGGTTVRQKVGENPAEVSINGVCPEGTARRIDELRFAKLVTLTSDRLARSMRCQVASASTDPLSSGGAADMDKGDLLYEYNINLVEVEI